MEPIRLNTIEEAIADFKEGNFVIVVDDEDREMKVISLLLPRRLLRKSKFHADSRSWSTLCSNHRRTLR